MLSQKRPLKPQSCRFSKITLRLKSLSRNTQRSKPRKKRWRQSMKSDVCRKSPWLLACLQARLITRQTPLPGLITRLILLRGIDTQAPETRLKLFTTRCIIRKANCLVRSATQSTSMLSIWSLTQMLILPDHIMRLSVISKTTKDCGTSRTILEKSLPTRLEILILILQISLKNLASVRTQCGHYSNSLIVTTILKIKYK